MSVEDKLIKSRNKILTLYVIIAIMFITIVGLFLTIKFDSDHDVEAKEIIKEQSKEEKVQLKIDKNENIVLFGDSITEIYPRDEIYGDMPIVNSGTSGYKTTDLLNKMDSMLYKYNPTKVILLIGINDVLYDCSEEKQTNTVNNIQEIVSKIQENRPKAKIYVESIYPVNKSLDKEFGYNCTNEIIRKMNSKIKAFCEEQNIEYINMYDELTDEDGKLNSKYTYDGLHPSTLGYAKITRVLLPYIYE